MTSKKKNVPSERFDRDVAGMPAFAAVEPLWIYVGPNSIKKAIPQDDEHCAIAEGCRDQLQTPHVSVGRSRTDLALPHPEGVVKQGFGTTKWAVLRFGNSSEAKQIIVAADTGTIDESGVLVQLLPLRESLKPEIRKQRNADSRKPKGVQDGRGTVQPENRTPDALTLMGVRTLTGQRNR